jgi:hypothetical protein
MSETVPQTQPEPAWDKLTLGKLRAQSISVLGITPAARTLKPAYWEVVGLLRGRGTALDFSCGNCRALIDAQVSACWACGADIDDGAAEPEMELEELRRAVSAMKLRGVDAAALDRAGLRAAYERGATARTADRSHRDAKLSELEADAINAELTEKMPDGWRKRRPQMYTSYWDPSGARRIAVFQRGLCVHFSVPDGELDKVPNLHFIDAAERKTRHAGRTNYEFTGDVSKDAVAVCLRVFKKHSK